MNTKRSKIIVFTYALVVFAVLAVPAQLTLAQETKGAFPENATAKTYGSGWECDRGYRKIAGSCIAVALPTNAYLTDSSYGSGWACQHGYQSKQDACVAVALPANAYLMGQEAYLL